MKILSISVILLFIFACKDKEEKAPLPACSCEFLNVLQNYSDQEGEIFFPPVGSTYQLIYTKGAISSKWGPDFVICSDSTFLSQIATKQIKDHAIVKFSCKVLGITMNQPCEFVITRVESPLYQIKVTSIEQK